MVGEEQRTTGKRPKWWGPLAIFSLAWGACLAIAVLGARAMMSRVRSQAAGDDVATSGGSVEGFLTTPIGGIVTTAVVAIVLVAVTAWWLRRR